MSENSHLDPLIDEVAQAMTAVPPDAELARRVSMRIAEANERRAVRWSGWKRWTLVPAASACVLLLGLLVARDRSVRLKPDATTVSAPSVAPRAVIVERPFPPLPTLRRTAEALAGAGQARGNGNPVMSVRAARPRPTARDPERVALRRSALSAVPPLTVEPIGLDRLDVQPLVEMDVIQITPIAIDRIEIAAMP
jgi:hypothetical protein